VTTISFLHILVRSSRTVRLVTTQ